MATTITLNTDGSTIRMEGDSKFEKKVYVDRVEYRLNGKLHREDGPAIEWTNGRKEWWINGERHREDGPAIVRTNGPNRWYMNGIQVPEF